MVNDKRIKKTLFIKVTSVAKKTTKAKVRSTKRQ
jgi:hypothetical protein